MSMVNTWDQEDVARELAETIPSGVPYWCIGSQGGVVIDGKWTSKDGFFVGMLGCVDPDADYQVGFVSLQDPATVREDTAAVLEQYRVKSHRKPSFVLCSINIMDGATGMNPATLDTVRRPCVGAAAVSKALLKALEAVQREVGLEVPVIGATAMGGCCFVAGADGYKGGLSFMIGYSSSSTFSSAFCCG